VRRHNSAEACARLLSSLGNASNSRPVAKARSKAVSDSGGLFQGEPQSWPVALIATPNARCCRETTYRAARSARSRIEGRFASAARRCKSLPSSSRNDFTPPATTLRFHRSTSERICGFSSRSATDGIRFSRSGGLIATARLLPAK